MKYEAIVGDDGEFENTPTGGFGELLSCIEEPGTSWIDLMMLISCSDFM